MRMNALNNTTFYACPINEEGRAEGAVPVTNGEGTFPNGSGWITVWIRIASRPSADCSIMVGYSSLGTSNINPVDNPGRVLLLPTGELRLQYNSGTYPSPVWNTLGTSAVLALDTWHRVDFSCENVKLSQAGTYATELKVNGTQVNRTTGLTITTTKVGVGDAAAFQQFEVQLTGSGTPPDIYYDDLWLDDAAFADNDGGVTIMRPNGAGNYTAWTGAYTAVDELPHDGTATEITCSSTAAFTCAMESAATAAVGGTIKAVQAVLYVRQTAGAPQLKTRIRSGTTDSDTTAGWGLYHTPPSTYTQPSCHKLRETDPNTSAAWTTGGLDAMEVGVSQTVASTSAAASAMAAEIWSTAPTAQTTEVFIPNVTSINPTNGPKAGSTAVTISGSNFTGTTGVIIGGVAATSVSVVNDGSITCTTAAASKAGTYNVQVTNADGIGVLVNAYTYNPGNSTGNSGNNAGGGTTVTVSFPAGLATGDMMAMTVTVRGGTGTTITDPSGWNLLGSQVNSTTVLAQKIYWKIATSGDVSAGNVVITITSNKASGVCVKVPDVEGVAPQSNMQANGSSTNVTAPTLTPKRLGAVSIYGGGVATGTTFTPPTNWTEPASADTASTGGSAASRTTTEEAYQVLASLSATGTVTGVAASGAVNIGAQMIFEPPGLIDAPLIDNTGVVFAPTLSGAAPVAFVPYAPIYTPFLAQ
jgi:hypothetical protein